MMNKKLIIGIGLLILIVLIAGIVIVMNMNKTNQDSTDISEQEERNTTSNINNLEENNRTETKDNELAVPIANETKDNELAVPIANETNTENMNTNTSKKTVVIYYSRSGSTKQIADYIKEKIGADVIRLETVKTYPSDYNEMLDTAKEEQRNGGRPELKNKNINIADYDTIFLGYPIWWGEIATPVYTFLDRHDLSGKEIAPFVTSGSSGLSGTPNDIKREESGAEILDAMSITSSTLSNYKSLTDNWLSKLGF